MGPQVKLQLLLTGQSFAANITNSEIPRMGIHVQLQTVPVLVNFVADDTHVGAGAVELFPVHVHFVSMQISGVQETFAAKLTVERFEASVIVIMLLKVLENVEGFFARITPVF